VEALTSLPPFEKEQLCFEPTSLLRCILRAVWGASRVVGRAIHRSCSLSQNWAFSATASSIYASADIRFSTTAPSALQKNTTKQISGRRYFTRCLITDAKIYKI
jgi:hypothetical protein